MKIMKIIPMIAVLLLSFSITYAGGLLTLGTPASDCSTVTIAVKETFNTQIIVSADVGGSTTATAPVFGEFFTITVDIPDQADGTLITLTVNAVGWDTAVTTVYCSIPASSSLVGNGNPVPLKNDGRIEPFGTDIVIFPLERGIEVYTSEGLLLFFIPAINIEMLEDNVEQVRLIGESNDGYVQIWRLPDGRFQANVGPDAEGKFHVVIWSGLGAFTNLETYTFFVN